MENKKGQIWFWLPRGINILFILFLTVFSLDVFGQGYGFWGTVLAFFMHNIPVLIMAGILWLSWRRPLISAILFPVLGIIYVINVIISGYPMMAFNPIAPTAIIVGVLYWISWKKEKIK